MFSASYWSRPFIVPRLTEDEIFLWERVGRCLPVWNSAIVPSSDVRLSEASAQNARVKLSKSSRVQIFAVSYFTVLIFVFWSWVAKIAKIWTSRKFHAIRNPFTHAQTLGTREYRECQLYCQAQTVHLHARHCQAIYLWRMSTSACVASTRVCWNMILDCATNQGLLVGSVLWQGWWLWCSHRTLCYQLPSLDTQETCYISWQTVAHTG